MKIAQRPIRQRFSAGPKCYVKTVVLTPSPRSPRAARHGLEPQRGGNYKDTSLNLSWGHMGAGHEAKLLGSWALQQYRVLVGGEPRPSILGYEPLGLLLYGADGFMSAVMMAGKRDKLGAPSLVAAGDAAALRAARECIAYAGRFEVRGDQVHHHVLSSLLPDWVGETLVRTIAWQGDRLTLTPPDELTSSGKTVQRALTWTRALATEEGT